MPPRSDSGRAGPDPAPRDAPGRVPPSGTALYVHLPHCVAKCTYCDFYSVVEERPDLDGTVATILAEARQRAPRAPRTVFVGGGTPSLLGEGGLARLLDGLDALTGFRDSAVEVSLECNPESLTPAKARRLVELGVDRLSIGVQSLDPALLELFGRAHTAEQAFAAYDAARAARPRSVGLDVIYGAPGQTLARWERDLARLLALAPDHVSAYSLAWEPGTALTHARGQGRLPELGEELELAFFERTRAWLREAGYDPYEVSNFALKGHECRHNQVYWRNEPYVGLGPGAVSRLGPTRFGNPRSIPAWRAAVAARGCAASWEETLPADARLAETWWLGLRTAEGVDPADARRRALAGGGERGALRDASPDACERLAAGLAAEGWLERVGARYRLSERGLPLADALSARFLDLFPAARHGTDAGAPEPETPVGAIGTLRA